ncbi:MAG TPA: phage antirepressor N-terminal domain-containing protein [Ktedonobacterales bacterium]|jgi:hypothetical protein|nr:phage antirepressor N-terminal domain-containing protein [Ktedonobacterales bacterium]
MADEELLQPAQQDVVNFYGKSIVAIRLGDGRVGAVFSDLCNALGLVRSSQLRRVREDDATFDQVLNVEMDPDGLGKRPTLVLTAWAIPIWLTGLNATRVAPEKRVRSAPSSARRLTRSTSISLRGISSLRRRRH